MTSCGVTERDETAHTPADVTRQLNGKPRIMVVDDDLTIRNFLHSFLSARGYCAVAFADAEEAVKNYHSERPAAVMLDMVIPGRMDGLGILAAFKRIDRNVPVIVMSAHGPTTSVVQAMKLGASDFISKPFSETDLDVPLSNALKQHQLSRDLAALREQLQSQSSRRHLLLGDSEAMADVRDLIDRIADTDVTVLIRGESGTGKELVARTLFAVSPRRDKPFVKVNCAALPTELLESELFGYERGAFTGAIQHKPGKFEFANHGTMFLDELAEMSPALQAKLLQVLQDGEFSRLGGKHDVHVDVRIIAATNRDLERSVANGEFREDLFFRLNVVSIQLPPLRERREELQILTDFFLKKYSVQYNKPLTAISQETMSLFMEYDWPGNVRELENLIKRGVVLGSEADIRRDVARGLALTAQRAVRPALPPSRGVRQTAPASPVDLAPVTPAGMAAAAFRAGHYSLKEIARTAARQAERELISRMLQHTHWNRKEAAEILGISYKALLYKIKENGLDKAS
jgi:two-component system, NtrC family, response regulator AtoC